MSDAIPPELAEKLRVSLSAGELAALGVPDPPSPPSGSFTLGDGAAPLPAKLRDYHAKPLAAYAATYNRSDRTIKRWNGAGRKASPPDLPPLDVPHRMAAWFRRRFPKERVPQELLDHELSAPKNPEPVQTATPNGHSDPPSSSPATTSGAVGEEKRITSIALDSLQLGEGEPVCQARLIAKANYTRVEEASRDGKSDDYRRWFPVWQDSLELLRKLEKEDREARKSSGALISRPLVETEIAQFIEALRIMRETMSGRVLAELEKAESKKLRRIIKLIGPLLAAAINRVRESEGAIFQNLESLTSPGAVRERLTLEAA